MKKLITLAISIILIMAMLCGCASPAKEKVYKNKVEVVSESETVLESETVSSRKLIKEVSLSVDTKDYDNYIESIRKNVTSSGGYIESSNESNYSELRTFTATIRIPVGKTDSFTEFASQNVTVNSRSENIQDVTEEYVDVEARIKVYKAEEESLIEIMKQANNVTDLLSVKESLAEVRAKIESYTAQLNSLENKTDYSTITLTVHEVEREVKSEGYWSKIGNNIVNGFKNVGKFITGLFAFALSAIPYLSLPVIITVIIIIAVRISEKKKKAKKDDK
ncbi:MAG: DUF4349 domain-containing protein [Clostridia bacterium]|nr:DUF4349 domain-containing protein [Clostridia bacterium]